MALNSLFVLKLPLNSNQPTGLLRHLVYVTCDDGKGKVLPYSLPSIGPRTDPGVQAVYRQVTFLSHTRR